MAARLRRFLHLERPRPARPDVAGAKTGVEARFDAVLRAGESPSGDSGDGRQPVAGTLPILRWLRRRWW